MIIFCRNYFHELSVDPSINFKLLKLVHGGHCASFQLFELTNEYVSETGDECFEWNEEGTQFWVTNVEIFSRDVLPGYFKHNNYASFIRQLNIYGLFAEI